MIHLITLCPVIQHLHEVEEDDSDVDQGVNDKDFSIFLDELATQDGYIDHNVSKNQ